MAHLFVVLRKILLNVHLYTHILRSSGDYKIEVLLECTSSYFTCLLYENCSGCMIFLQNIDNLSYSDAYHYTTSHALICAGPVVK